MENNLYDNTVNKLKNNKFVVLLLLIAVIYFGVSKVISATKDNIEIFNVPLDEQEILDDGHEDDFNYLKVKVINILTREEVENVFVEITESDNIFDYSDSKGLAILEYNDELCKEKRYLTLRITHKSYKPYSTKILLDKAFHSNNKEYLIELYLLNKDPTENKLLRDEKNVNINNNGNIQNINISDEIINNY